jgi:hypothetical protein
MAPLVPADPHLRGAETELTSFFHNLIGLPRALGVLGLSLATVLSLVSAVAADDSADEPVNFVRDVWPILVKQCNDCHGDDDQEGRLRLDSRSLVSKGGVSGPLFKPGSAKGSLLLTRLTGGGDEDRMPLDGDPLSDQQIDTIRRWIDQGATWPEGVGSDATEIPKHWAYEKPRRPSPPKVKQASWPRNAVDRFVLARLEKEGLKPTPEASKARLLRRVYLDLIGLPPSVEVVEAFERDQQPGAYERVVDSLLKSKRYGERWARPWLDLARYADTNGYQADQFRSVWPYRDWVIDAMNADMPFDQFTVEQFAGDLLPNANIKQKIATGFFRLTTCNVEAGVDPEENRVEQVIDRVNTAGTVWLGTSIECGQCHTHKYDPFSQRDYYRLFAYFNNTPLEVARPGNKGVSYDFVGPKMKLPTSGTAAAKQRTLQEELSTREKQLRAATEKAKTEQIAWESKQAKRGKLPAKVAAAIRVEPATRNTKQRDRVQKYFLDRHPQLKPIRQQIANVKKQLAKIKAPTTLVMVELAEPRKTHILRRGNFLDTLATVRPGTPGVLHSSLKNLPGNRLGLAKWLVDPANPLTARVTVNRWWAEIFGQGIVTTLEDFGTQCEPPTHPKLLDYLAVELVENGWSMKKLHKLIVMSATYRQSSNVTPKLIERDPYNRLYARGPRFRLSAEQVRDNALAISGLLSNKMAGPPVFPPQPPNIWRHIGRNEPKYATSTGEDRFRRGIYVFWRRSAPYASFVNFDAPNRSSCVVKRPRTNTPLQALTLLNDPAYIEMAAALATRILTERKDLSDAQRIDYGFRLTVARKPNAAESGHLLKVYQRELTRLSADPKTTKALVAGTKLPGDTDRSRWAAWLIVANILLNLDETVTKG